MPRLQLYHSQERESDPRGRRKVTAPDLKGDTKESMVRPGERFRETEAARGHSAGVYGRMEEEERQGQLTRQQSKDK